MCGMELTETNTSSVTMVGPINMQNKIPTRYLICLSFIIHAFGLIPYGYSMAVLNSTQFLMSSFINESFAAEYGYSLNVKQVNLLYALANNGWDIGGALGCIIYAPIADHFGRRYTIFFVPSLFTIIATMLYAISYCINLFEPLILGRMVSGVGAAVALLAVSVYLNEASPVKQRGIINGWHTVATQTWQMVGVGLGTVTALGTSSLWVWLMCWPAIPAVICMCIPLPETPSFVYIAEKDLAKPKTIRLLLKLHGKDINIPEVFTEYERTKLLLASQMGIKQIWNNKVTRKTLIISHGLTLAATLTGVNLTIHFSTSMFLTAGLSQEVAPYFSLLPVALTAVFGSIVPIVVDRVGRRPLLLLSVFVQFMGTRPWLSYAAVFGACGISIGYAIGLGPVKQLSISEMVPQRARATNMKYCFAIAFLASFLDGLVYPIANESIGALCLIPLVIVPQIATFIFIYYKLPETRHRTTMQVYDELGGVSETTTLLGEND